MKKPSYLLVIMDSSGGITRRISIAKRSVNIVIGAIVLCALGTIGVGFHGFTLFNLSNEAQAITEENQELNQLLAGLSKEIPKTELAILRNNETFRQVWIRSGLGRSPSLLGVGPISNNPRGAETTSFATQTPFDDHKPEELLPLIAAKKAASRALQNEMELILEYFHDAERLLQNTPSIRPAEGSWATSSFGRRRDPMHGGWVMHKGIDLAGYTGMPITSPADGIVIWTGRRGGYGLTIVIDHGYGLQSHYAHLNRYLVTVGKKLRRGDIIAEMGSTGKSTGPHLHYEVRRNGEPVNPIHFILD